MPSVRVLYRWARTIRSHFPRLHHYQVLGLALFSLGVVLARQCQLSRVAEELAFMGKAETVERRLRRWLSNARLDLAICCQAWMRWVFSQYTSQRPILLVDETKLGKRIGVLMVSLAYRGRAIPLVWCCYVANSEADYPAEGQVGVIKRLLQQVQSVLPPDCRPVVQADQGIGNSSKLMKAVQALSMSYLMRVKKSSVFTSRRGKRMVLSALCKPGESWCGAGTLFVTYGSQVRCIVHVLWDKGYDDMWCLATNDRHLKARDYALRMWQEESFRDLKRGGWQWNASFVRDPQRAARLILVLALAYAWVLTQGALVLTRDENEQRQITSGRRCKYSIFRLGLRLVKRLLYLDPNRIHFELCFPPPYPLVC